MLTKVKSLRVATLAGVPQQRGHKDGPLSTALFVDPTGICISDEGVVYVTDSGNHRIRRFTLDADGYVETVAGCGRSGRKDGPALKALLSKPSGICFDLNGSIIFVEEAGCTLRTLIEGQVSTIIGWNGSGFLDGPVTSAQLRSPRGVCQAPDGTIFIADNGNHRIRRVDTSGMVHSIGSGRATCQDGNLTNGSMLYPSSVCVTSSGMIYVGELYRVRRINLEENTIITYDMTYDSSLTAGVVPAPGFDNHGSADNNRIFYTDSNGCRIMCLNEKGKVKLIAGAGRGGGYLDGPASESKFTSPHGIAFTPDGALLICDSNHCIRIIRDIYPPSERSLPSASSFSLEALLELDASKSTSDQSPLVPFHPNLAALAYPSLKTLSDTDVERASSELRFLQIASPTSDSSNVSEISSFEPLENRIHIFYTVVASDPKSSISSLLSALNLCETLRMPLELIQFILKRFLFALNRAALTPARLTDMLVNTATSEFGCKNAAYLIVDRLKSLGVTASQILPQLEASIKKQYPDYFLFLSELLGEKISSSTRSMVKPALSVLKLPRVSSSSYSSSSSSNAGTSSSMVASSSKSKRRGTAVISPFLISRCTSLFWAKVAPTINRTFAPAIVALEELVDSLPSSDSLIRSQALLNPNYSISINDHKIECHDWILYARWPWFRSLWRSGLEETRTGSATIPSGSFSYAGFVALLYYLYSHKTDLFTPSLSVELLRNAEEFRIVELLSRPFKPDPAFEPLVRHCQQALTQDLSVSNCADKLKLARELDLQASVHVIISFISRNIASVSATKTIWEEIVQLDAETIKEIFVSIPWENVQMKSV